MNLYENTYNIVLYYCVICYYILTHSVNSSSQNPPSKKPNSETAWPNGGRIACDARKRHTDSVSERKEQERERNCIAAEQTMAENDSEKAVGLWEGLIKTHQNSLKALFSPKKADTNGDQSQSQTSLAIPHLSPHANSVVSRCSRSNSFMAFISTTFAIDFLSIYAFALSG